MPLSKEKQREVMRNHMRKKRKMFIPKVKALQPNRYVLGHLRVCPDYEVKHPGNHFEHCSYINPMFIPKSDSVIPKLPWYTGASDHFGEVSILSSSFQTYVKPNYPIGYQYPDGRVRTPMVVQPSSGEKE